MTAAELIVSGSSMAAGGHRDFANSGFGPRSRELIDANFISPDLTKRIITRYDALTGCEIVLWRTAILTECVA